MIGGHGLDLSVFESGHVTGSCELRKIGKFFNWLRNYWFSRGTCSLALFI